MGCEPVGFVLIGSRYRRDYCARCYTPIRVPAANVGKINFCERCGDKFGADTPTTGGHD